MQFLLLFTFQSGYFRFPSPTRKKKALRRSPLSRGGSLIRQDSNTSNGGGTTTRPQLSFEVESDYFNRSTDQDQLEGDEDEEVGVFLTPEEELENPLIRSIRKDIIHQVRKETSTTCSSLGRRARLPSKSVGPRTRCPKPAQESRPANFYSLNSRAGLWHLGKGWIVRRTTTRSLPYWANWLFYPNWNRLYRFTAYW